MEMVVSTSLVPTHMQIRTYTFYPKYVVGHHLTSTTIDCLFTSIRGACLNCITRVRKSISSYLLNHT